MSNSLIEIFAGTCNAAKQVCIDDLPTTAANGSTVQTIIQIVIAVTAVLAVMFIAIGGLRYILSQGDPQAVSKAKSTIVYALIGLAIAILAQVIVSFVIGAVF